MAWRIGPDAVLDPTRWLIVIPDMFSNGRSSSAGRRRRVPPLVTIADNVQAPYRLLTEEFEVTAVACASTARC